MNSVIVGGWIDDPENTLTDDLHGLVWLGQRDPDGQFAARIEDSGCVHIWRYHNVPNDGDPDSTDYIHICDLDEFIDRLEALQIMAKVRFGEWPR